MLLESFISYKLWFIMTDEKRRVYHLPPTVLLWLLSLPLNYILACWIPVSLTPSSILYILWTLTSHVTRSQSKYSIKNWSTKHNNNIILPSWQKVENGKLDLSSLWSRKNKLEVIYIKVRSDVGMLTTFFFVPCKSSLLMVRIDWENTVTYYTSTLDFPCDNWHVCVLYFSYYIAIEFVNSSLMSSFSWVVFLIDWYQLWSWKGP